MAEFFTFYTSSDFICRHLHGSRQQSFVPPAQSRTGRWELTVSEACCLPPVTSALGPRCGPGGRPSLGSRRSAGQSSSWTSPALPLRCCSLVGGRYRCRYPECRWRPQNLQRRHFLNSTILDFAPFDRNIGDNRLPKHLLYSSYKTKHVIKSRRFGSKKSSKTDTACLWKVGYTPTLKNLFDIF